MRLALELIMCVVAYDGFGGSHDHCTDDFKCQHSSASAIYYNASNCWAYAPQSVIGFCATPESQAALAAAIDTVLNIRGSNSVGTKYLGPKVKSLFSAKAARTIWGMGSRANSANAFAHASFIVSLISLALTSNVPRKRNGKHIALFIWFG